MALRISEKLRNDLMKAAGLAEAMSNCVLKIYTGSQPATAEAAPTGTLLCTFSDNGGALTREVLSVGSVALTGGGAGSVDTMTVNGVEIMGSATAFNTSLTQTATDIVKKINDNPRNKLFEASNVGGTSQTITITAVPGLGSLPNGWVVASTETTITNTDNNMAGGVSPANCLNWGTVADAVLPKLETQTWKGNAVAGGTAGWFRIEASVTDPLSLDSTEVIRRIDGAIGTSGAEINMQNTTITALIDQTIQSFALELPTA